MKKVIVRGYYGRDNLGDELMKDIFIRELNVPDIELYIMNSSPESLRNEYDISTPEELTTGQIPSLTNTVKRLCRIVSADVYIYGGGTIITDKHSYFHLVENAIYFACRKLLRKKSLLISVGATNFHSKRGLFFAQRLIRNSTYAYIRDEDSYNYLKKITHNSNRLVQSADMVLLTRDAISEKRYGDPDDRIGLCLMPYYYVTYHQRDKDEQLLDSLVTQIAIIGREMLGFAFTLIPIQAGNNDATDYEFCKKVFDRLKGEIDITISKCNSNEEKIHELSRCKYVISMRLHALMLTKLMGNRVFAINHNEKIEYFMRHYDSIKNHVTLNNIERLAPKFLESIKSSCQESEELINTDYNLAKGNISIIKSFLGMEVYG